MIYFFTRIILLYDNIIQQILIPKYSYMQLNAIEHWALQPYTRHVVMHA